MNRTPSVQEAVHRAAPLRIAVANLNPSGSDHVSTRHGLKRERLERRFERFRYATNDKASKDVVSRRVRKHLKPFFKGWQMADLTTADVRTYILT